MTTSTPHAGKTARRFIRELIQWLVLAIFLLFGQVVVLADFAAGEFVGNLDLLLTPVLGGDSTRYLTGKISPETVPYASYIITAQGLSELGFGSIGIRPSGEISEEGRGATLVVLLQMFVALIAARCLLSIGRSLGSTAGGWFAAGWFLMFFQIAQWTRYVLTESLFYSLTLIIMWLSLCRFRHEWHRYVALTPLLLFGYFLRPNGFILLGAVASFIVLVQFRLQKALGLIAAVWMALLLVQGFGPFVESPASSQTPSRFVQGEVFWNQDDFQRAMPPPDGAVESVGDLVIYVVSHPVDSALLGLSRVVWEMIQFRPWYATYYNIALAVSMVLFYALSIVGWRRCRRSQLNLFVMCLTAPAVLLIAATWAIYEGRFAWWFLVTWLPWVGIGAETVWRSARRRLFSGVESTMEERKARANGD